ncbi:hypothetical protein GCM10022419_017210 [Nonomuraea rosea]|uniref:Ribbon-helix-helix protein, CopG family n=1 Tax=Nonomuraea rosea TaxID=638574 RepID=A0ABP6VLA2_9ACTN
MAMKPKATTIRVSVKTRDRIAALAKKAGEPMTAIIDQAIREMEKKQRWQRVAEQMEQTQRTDPQAWADYLAESGSRGEWGSFPDDLVHEITDWI